MRSRFMSIIDLRRWRDCLCRSRERVIQGRRNLWSVLWLDHLLGRIDSGILSSIRLFDMVNLNLAVLVGVCSISVLSPKKRNV